MLIYFFKSRQIKNYESQLYTKIYKNEDIIKMSSE